MSRPLCAARQPRVWLREIFGPAALKYSLIQTRGWLAVHICSAARTGARASLALALAGRAAGAQAAGPVAAPAPARAAAVAQTAAVQAAAPRPAPVSVRDLPLEEVEAQGEAKYFVIFLTGDGNFAALDKGVSAELTSRGMPVVAFNQRSYLWSGKTPEQTGADLARVIAWYREKWRRDTVVVVGYSRGAGTAPFAVNRLPAPLRSLIRGVVLIGPENTAGLHFRLRDLLSNKPAADELPMAPEMKRLSDIPVMCIYGAADRDGPCPSLTAPSLPVRLESDHYFEGFYAVIGRRIASWVLPSR